MDQPPDAWNDERVEQLMGNLLRAGVILAAAVVVAGGALYLVRHGTEPEDYREYRPDRDPELRRPAGILHDALALRARGVIQLGMLLLIATPVARVAFSVFAFARERDLTYVILTLFVLSLLLYSLFVGEL